MGRRSGHVRGTSPSDSRANSGSERRSVATQATVRARRAKVDVPGERVKNGVSPRLLSLENTAIYLGVSPWTVRDLEAAGVLPGVRIPLPNGGDLRKLLFDREDLDKLVERWKDVPNH